MKAIIPNFNNEKNRPYYLQLYDHIKLAILNNEILADEKLPSLRSLANSLKLSITTIELAYNQLTVEGYIYSKPQSGYFVADITYGSNVNVVAPQVESSQMVMEQNCPKYLYDLTCFDFNKWKKCCNKILTEYPHLLMFESDPQGEIALRYEISKYVYRSRGVICSPEQIVIGAGTQQITNHLATILQKICINHVAVEEPGYLPVKNIFRDRGFLMTPVQVSKEGINITRLPANIRSTVYVCPSNQFPTGAIMPVAKRYELLEWANINDSIIIEDDYDSELRYFGKPVPALQGLDANERVVYLGSFSSTLFSSIKISYMVLPPFMKEIFMKMRSDYTQTCSKTEQLTLALFMEQGLYQTNIKKLRNLYSQKLQSCVSAFNKYGKSIVFPINTSSGVNMIINVKSDKTVSELCSLSQSLGIIALPATRYTEDPAQKTSTQVDLIGENTSQNCLKNASILLYYNQIPLDIIDRLIKELIDLWKK